MTRLDVAAAAFTLALVATRAPAQPSRRGPGTAALGPAAYAFLNSRVQANRTSFHVYKDADSGFNHGFPSGLWGNLGHVTLDTACVDDPGADGGCTSNPGRFDRQRGNVMSVRFDFASDEGFTGVNIEEPENWGGTRKGAGYDLRGATHVVFEIRSPTPGGLDVRFGVAEAVTDFVHIPQSTRYSALAISLAALGLSHDDLADVHVLFSVGTNAASAQSGSRVLLDNIRFEPVPAAQGSALGFPVATETFGVVPVQQPAPGRAPVPPDQVNRNVATTYESALVLLALVARSSPSDLDGARLLADSLDYALAHENDGDPLPKTDAGTAGLHNAYENGDIPLHNDQGPGTGQAGDVRMAGFSASSCPSGFCLVLDGATGGNNAFAVLALLAAYARFGEPRYLVAAKAIGEWIEEMLEDRTGTGFGGYYLGYPDEGVRPKTLVRAKSVENNADIFAAFTTLAAMEQRLGRSAEADEWTGRAEVAGDFVMEMFDAGPGRFFAGTVPDGTIAAPGVCPDGSRRGNDVVNTCDFLDANSFPILAMARAPRYHDQVDWRRPAQFILDTFGQTITADGLPFSGFNIVPQATAGPEGIAWEFTAQVVAALDAVARRYGDARLAGLAGFYLDQLRQARVLAPFGDGRGIVASTLDGAASVSVYEQCLSTPFQCIPERVGLAATTWAVMAERRLNVLAGVPPIGRRCLGLTRESHP
jgi:hypothetical protein